MKLGYPHGSHSPRETFTQQTGDLISGDANNIKIVYGILIDPIKGVHSITNHGDVISNILIFIQSHDTFSGFITYYLTEWYWTRRFGCFTKAAWVDSWCRETNEAAAKALQQNGSSSALCSFGRTTKTSSLVSISIVKCPKLKIFHQANTTDCSKSLLLNWLHGHVGDVKFQISSYPSDFGCITDRASHAATKAFQNFYK
jgi:hypothetical protein